MSEAELNRMWQIYDIEVTRALPKTKVAQMLRACGRMLLNDQMDSLLKRFPDPMTCDQFKEAFGESVSGEPKEKALQTALSAFDVKETNDLSRLEVTQMLTAMNEKISKAELDSLLEKLTFSAEDRVMIDDLFKHMTRPLRTIAHGSIVGREVDKLVPAVAAVAPPASGGAGGGDGGGDNE